MLLRSPTKPLALGFAGDPDWQRKAFGSQREDFCAACRHESNGILLRKGDKNSRKLGGKQSEIVPQRDKKRGHPLHIACAPAL